MLNTIITQSPIYILMGIGLTVLIYSFTLDKVRTTDVSWYGPGFDGNTTANGEIFNQEDFTAASPILPFNTLVEVTNSITGKSVIVRINDRGPYKMDKDGVVELPLTPHPERGLDLSKASFEAIAELDRGVINVTYKIID